MHYKQSIELSQSDKNTFSACATIKPIIDRGEGIWVWDVDGNKYMDINSGQFSACFGHAYKPMIDVMVGQMKKIYHTNTSVMTQEVYVASKRMSDITGSEIAKTIFLSTGSEAIECALRYAKFITSRNNVLSLDLGYHGLTLGAQSATMGGVWARPKVVGNYSVVTPDIIHNPDVSPDTIMEITLKDLEDKFALWGNDTAAFLLEPVTGVGGMLVIPPQFVQRVRRLCDHYGVLLIADECQCGFARSGKWFGYEHSSIVPDIIVTAKAMGMGLPVSAVTFMNERVKDIEGKITHFSSHQNDPLSARIVTFVIDQIYQHNLLESNTKNGEYLLKKLTEICRENKVLCNARGLGLMCAIDLNEKYCPKGTGTVLIDKMQEHGVLMQAVRQGRTFRILPSYFISSSDIDILIRALVESSNEIESELGMNAGGQT